MAGSGKPVKTNATNSAGSKKRRVVSAATVEGDVPVESTPSVEPTTAPCVVDPVVDPSNESTDSSDTKPKLLDVTTIISQLKEEVAASITAMKLVATKIRELEKAHNKEKRAKGSRKRKSPEPETTIEQKPEKLFEIEDTLRDFLGAPPGEKVGKKAARKALSVYIKENGLQDPDDRTLIKPDEKLTNLFGPPRFVTTKGRDGYSNLNALRYIQRYFIDPNVGETAPKEEIVSA